MPLVHWRMAVLASIEDPVAHELPSYFNGAVLRLSAGGSSRDFALDLLAGAQSIDAAFAGVHIFGPPATGELTAFSSLRTRLRKGLSLHDDGEFGIVPSPRQAILRPRRGQLLRDEFDYLNVIPMRSEIPVTYAVNTQPGILSGLALERVAVLPVVVKPDEVEWTLEGADAYRVGLAPAHKDAIERRLRDALDWVLQGEPEVVLLPELVGDPTLDVMIKRHLSRRAVAGEYVPTLVLCGSIMHDDGEKIRNRARVIAGDGGDLWLQNKMHAYEFTIEEQERANWPLPGTDRVDRMECIDIDDRQLTVFDLGPFLRCAVLICEDFKASSSLEALEPWDVTLLLVPIMNGPLNPNDWTVKRAVGLADRPGAMSVVANSGVLVAEPDAGCAPDLPAAQLAHAIGSPRADVSWATYPGHPGAHPTALLGTLTPHKTA